MSFNFFDDFNSSSSYDAYDNPGYGERRGVYHPDNFQRREQYYPQPTEYLDWVQPKHHGMIIGRNGETIKEIQQQSGAKVKIEKPEEGGRCYVKGASDQIQTAIHLIREKIAEKERQKSYSTKTPSADANWTQVNFVKPDMMGKIIGKNGETIKSFQSMYGVKLRSEAGKLFIYGDQRQENNIMAIDGLKELLKDKIPSNWSQTDFVKPDMIGKIVGRNGETIKSFEEMYDVKLRTDKGKLFIFGDLEKSNNVMAVEGLKELIKNGKEKPSSSKNDLSSDENWTHLSFVKPNMMGKVIGRNGETIKSLEEMYEVKLRSQSGDLFIYGDPQIEKNKMAIEGLKELLKVKEEDSDEASDDWEIVQHLDPNYIGMIIGKQGSQAKKFEREYGIQIKGFRKESASYLAIKGNNEDSKERFRIRARSLAIHWNMKKVIKPAKKAFGVGNYDVTLVHSEYRGLQKMVVDQHGDSFLAEKSLSSIPGLRETLMQFLQKTKNAIRQLGGGVSNYVMHSGRIYCKKPPGSFQMKEILPAELVYQRLNKGDLNISKINSLPIVTDFFRYDMSIFTPAPYIRIRYKVFLGKHNGRVTFITCREAGANVNEFITADTMPGYVSLPDYKIGAIDVVDPTTSNTVRMNFNVYSDEGKFYESKLKVHLQALNHFFQNIEIVEPVPNATNANKMDIRLPELPDGFVISYLRKSMRKTYRFSGSNMLRTSEEYIFLNNEILHDTNREENVIDLYFVNQNIDDLMEDEDLDEEVFADEVDKLLKFSDTMLQFLS